MDDKVSKKAIWEGFITSDESPMTATQMRSQPQMMFCYKCNNVIPNNSTFCPYCQIKLFAECPKCGAKYSSQYPACGQCGTNREEYLLAQRREQERKAAIERENTRKRLEEEARERLQKEAYIKENEDIKKTKEYESAYVLITESFDIFYKICKRRRIITLILYIIGVILAMCSAKYDIMESVAIAYALLGFPICIAFLAYKESDSKQKKFISKYVSNNKGYDKSLFTTDLIAMVVYQGKDRLSDCCIIAYRKKYGLTFNYKWHSLR